VLLIAPSYCGSLRRCGGEGEEEEEEEEEEEKEEEADEEAVEEETRRRMGARLWLVTDPCMYMMCIE